MFNKKKSFFNWGRNIKINPTQILPRNLDELKKLTNKKSFIITGNQRSFGDAALNNKLIISMKNFNRILSKDYKRGVIELESGVRVKSVSALRSGINVKATLPDGHFSAIVNSAESTNNEGSMKEADLQKTESRIPIQSEEVVKNDRSNPRKPGQRKLF